MACARCQDRDGSPGDILCPTCRIAVKVEVARGLAAFKHYLERWAAFRAWEREIPQ